MSGPFFQNTYPYNMPIGVPGRIADCGFKNTLSPISLEVIQPALAVYKPVGMDYRIQLPRLNQATAVLSADLVTSNSVAVTFNGVALTPVVFTTNHLTTMGLIATAIAAEPNVASATVGGASNRTITVIMDAGYTGVINSFVVTLGASQATATLAQGTSGVFFGVAQEVYNRMASFAYPTGPNLVQSSGFPSGYYAGQVVPTLTQGRIYVIAEDVVTSDSAVYVRVAASGLNTQVGSFRSDADSGTAILVSSAYALWREGNGTAGGIAVLELNIP